MTGAPNGAVDPNRWITVIRRAQLSTAAKLVAYAAASRANPDGSSIFPGIARLAIECGLSYSTVRLALDTLRNAGLISLVRRGSRKSGRADEYCLILSRHPVRPIPIRTEEQQIQAIADLARSESQPWAKRVSTAGGPAVTLPKETLPVSLSRRAQSLAARLPDATGEERETIVRMIESQKPRNYLAYLRSIPTGDLLDMLDEARCQLAAAAPSGPGKPDWCGQCDTQTRLLGRDGDNPARCPRCHPLELAGLRQSRTRRPPTADGPSPEVQEELGRLRARFPRTV